jgi:heme/copper-type cytochrome/quinol oxidase subunit 2
MTVSERPRPTRAPWIVWPLAALGIAVVLLAPNRAAAAPSTRLFRVEAGGFAYAPAIVRVNAGDRVTLEVAATDVVHGLYIDGYDLSITAEPGQTARLTFTAARPGVFRLRCSVTCGPLHPFMIGKLYVGPGLAWWRGLAVLGVAATAAWLTAPKPWPA